LSNYFDLLLRYPSTSFQEILNFLSDLIMLVSLFNFHFFISSDRPVISSLIFGFSRFARHIWAQVAYMRLLCTVSYSIHVSGVVCCRRHRTSIMHRIYALLMFDDDDVCNKCHLNTTAFIT